MLRPGGSTAATPLLPKADDEQPAGATGGPDDVPGRPYSLVADLAWARDEMQAMLVDFCCPASIRALPLDEQRGCAALRLNPIYWILLGACVVAVLSGRWVHALVGQGGPVRPTDESLVEHEARVWWIYTTDGPFAMAAVGAFFSLIYELTASSTDRNEIYTNVCDALIDVSYIVGNVFFLNAMRKRNTLEVRIGIVANGTFAAGLVVLLVYGLYWTGWRSSMTPTKRFEWCMRAFSVLFFVLATAIYTGLWGAYDDAPSAAAFPLTGGEGEDDDDDRRGSSRCWPRCHRVLHYVALAAAALVVWWFLLFALFIGGPKIVWDAVA